MADTITPCQAALWFASQGFPVLPLHSLTEDRRCTCGDAQCHSPGKHPFARYVLHGLKDATTDLDVIRKWFREHYWLNFGVLTDRLLVVDVDPRNGRRQSVGRYERPANPRRAAHLARAHWRRRRTYRL